MSLSRGGKRPGAGRQAGSSILTLEQRLRVGAECQERWQAALRANLHAAEQAAFGNSEYKRQIAAVNLTPLEDRAGLMSLTGADGVPILDEEGDRLFITEAGRSHAEDIEGARKELAGIEVDSPDPAPRIIEIRAKRPYGLKEPLLRAVSAWAATQFERPVSVRMVESCWAELKAFLKTLDP